MKAPCRAVLLATAILVNAPFTGSIPVVIAQSGALPAAVETTAPQYFSEVERAAILQFWNAPKRYEIGARLEAATQGPFVVRLTPEASTWFWNYNRALKPGALVPSQEAKASNPQTQEWESWIVAKLTYDCAVAQQQADAANNGANNVTNAPAQLNGATTPATLAVKDVITLPLPPYPGLMPSSLQAVVGNAPAFAASVAPRRHVIRFETGETITYNDYLAPKSPRYAYFRFAQGVGASGTSLSKLPPEVLDQIFAGGNMTPSEAHVMRAVSLLEGGFDSINTYDTGYVSVGFIQFAALQEGAGSLGGLLRYEKQNDPVAFAQDFHSFGVDVNEKGALVVIDPATGVELSGPAAALKIVDDKRLTAVFHLAGMRSLAFRSAQLYVAKSNYYPANLPVAVVVNGQVLMGKVQDVIHSEAGLATLFDRKVNTGNIRPLNDVLSQTMTKHGLTSLDQLLPYEREIVTAMKWRHDFLKDSTLSQPD